MGQFFEKYRHDLKGIFFAALSVFLFFSLISFNPADPSFNSSGVNLKVTNYCGYVGSFLADLIFQIFGVVSWIMAAAFGYVSFQHFLKRANKNRGYHWLWGILLIMTLNALVGVYFSNSKIYNNQILVSGLLGFNIAKALTLLLNPVGVQIVLWSLVLALSVFFFEKPVAELLRIPDSKTWSSLVRRFRGWMDDLNRSLKQSMKPAKKAMEIAKPKEVSVAAVEAKQSKFIPVTAADTADLEPEEQAPLFIEVPPKTAATAASPERRKVVMKAKVQQRIENWNLPKISLLEDPPLTRIRVDEKEIRRKAEVLTDKLARFSVTGEVVGAKPGPAVTMFEYKPSADVKLNKITDLADDLSLALSSESLRILAPIPGRDVVGIETSNAQRETVYLKDLLADEEFWKEDVKLPIALGKQVDGTPKIVDLRKMPHLMIAGTTGSGKSVFTVSSITGLLFRHSPKTLRLIMVDPKQVDLVAFEKIPHLIMPPVTDSRKAVNALKWAVREMEKRYRSMSEFGARGLEAYNETVSKLTKEQIEEHEKINQEMESQPGKKGDQYYYHTLPYIVIVVEEFGDLMTVDKSNVEASVVRLAQMARACGIHLILAMQSPRREVVTGLIKTNIPGRISFKVNSNMDSRIILDETGAERLLAQGDMLYKNPGGSTLLRHHGPFLKNTEIDEVAKFWADQAPPEYDPSAVRALEGHSSGDASEGFSIDGGGAAEGEYDDRYNEIITWAATQKAISASLIQRRFQLGYPRAAKIMDIFEREGVVGPANGSKPRQVLIHDLNELTE